MTEYNATAERTQCVHHTGVIRTGKDKDKDKDLFIGQQEFGVGYLILRLPSSRRVALGLYVILTL